MFQPQNNNNKKRESDKEINERSMKVPPPPGNLVRNRGQGWILKIITRAVDSQISSDQSEAGGVKGIPHPRTAYPGSN